MFASFNNYPIITRIYSGRQAKSKIFSSMSVSKHVMRGKESECFVEGLKFGSDQPDDSHGKKPPDPKIQIFTLRIFLQPKLKDEAVKINMLLILATTVGTLGVAWIAVVKQTSKTLGDHLMSHQPKTREVDGDPNSEGLAKNDSGATWGLHEPLKN